MIKVITTVEGFASLEERWNGMMRQCAEATPYQTFALVRLCWEMWHPSGSSLYIVCHHKKEEWPADAIFPCYLLRGVLHWIDFHCDFCVPVETVPYNERYEMYAEVVRHIAADPAIRSVSFSRVPATHPLLGYFRALGGYSKTEMSNAYTVIPLDMGEKDSISAISTLVRQKQRKIREIVRNGDRGGYEHFLSSSSPYPERDVRELADAMTATGMRNAAYLSDRFLSFFRRLYDSGVVSVMVGYDVQHSPVSCFFLLRDEHRNELIEWVLLYKERRHNLLLMTQLLDYMYAHGICRLNMACGIYAYKLTNFHPEVHNVCSFRMWRTHGDYRRQELRALAAGVVRSVCYRLKHL